MRDESMRERTPDEGSDPGDQPGPSAMRVYQGIGVAPGISIGPAYTYARRAHDVEHERIEADDVEGEVKRFTWALGRAEKDLNKIISVTREKLGAESASIFEAQVMMLHDSAFTDPVLDLIRDERCKADYAVKTVMTEHQKRMQASESQYLRERVHDLQDVQDRLIAHLRREKLLSAVDPESIIVAENLTAADLVLFSRRGILGCALDFGGATSHVSIMARSLGTPAVMSLHGLTAEVDRGDLLILDGIEGKVIVQPDEATLDAYRTRQARYKRLLLEHKQLVPLASETLDGHHVALRGNLEFREELDLLDEYGAEGVGLFRTEMLFLMGGRLDYTEEEQYEVYREIVERIAPQPTTFRLLDLGGDKMLPIAHREHNPFLGWRGIRVLLDREEVLLPQLRALLRASAHGPIRLLLPMVTNLDELQRFRAILNEAMAGFDADGTPYDAEVPVGIMVEVPAVALMADQFACCVDFFSLGTNDLTQYTLAVDRGNDLVSDRYQELHPGVLQLIGMTVEAAKRNGIPVSLCGEMGGNPRATPILVGLGVEELSASPTYLPEVKRVLRALQLSEAKALAEAAIRAPDAQTVRAMLDTWLETHGCGLLHFLTTDVEPPDDAGNGRRPQHAAQQDEPHDVPISSDIEPAS